MGVLRDQMARVPCIGILGNSHRRSYAVIGIICFPREELFFVRLGPLGERPTIDWVSVKRRFPGRSAAD